MIVYPITPVAKPRQTRKDKFNPSKRVLVYRAFADECRLLKVQPQPGDQITFGIPMWPSWSQAKKKRTAYTPCLQTPDIDNLAKALLDATWPEDCVYWDLHAKKLWTWVGCIVIEPAAQAPKIGVDLIQAMEDSR